MLVAALALAPHTFRNPIAPGADPCLQYDKGWYYLSVTTGRDVMIRKARRLSELRDAEAVTVYRSEDPAQNRDVWAPEFHRIGGRWYLYVCGGNGAEPSHRIWVAEGQGDTPMGPYRFKAKLLTDPKDEFYAIDFHPLRLRDGRMYGVWCGRPSAAGQGLYIARMANPWTLTGPRRYLDVSGFGSPVVREGPETLQHGGKVFLVYSSSAADTPDYKLGMTVASEKADLLNPAVWKQAPEPIFVRNDAAGVYGPGHNFFFRSPDGKEDWQAYHAKSGKALTYGDRSTRASRVTWKDGLPDLGIPVAEGVEVTAPSGER